MTDADGRSRRDRAVTRVQQLLEAPLEQAVSAGHMIAIPVGEIVTAVEREIGDDALRLPRYYPADEGQWWLLGVGTAADPDTGQPRSVHLRWQTGLPHGRIGVEISENGLDLAQFTASPDTLATALRMMLAACEHSSASQQEQVRDHA